MPSPHRVKDTESVVGIIYVIATIIFWVSAVPLGLFIHSKCAAALNFVAGLIFLVLWQTRCGENTMSN
jgi:hypothetical protein